MNLSHTTLFFSLFFHLVVAVSSYDFVKFRGYAIFPEESEEAPSSNRRLHSDIILVAIAIDGDNDVFILNMTSLQMSQKNCNSYDIYNRSCNDPGVDKDNCKTICLQSLLDELKLAKSTFNINIPVGLSMSIKNQGAHFSPSTEKKATYAPGFSANNLHSSEKNPESTKKNPGSVEKDLGSIENKVGSIEKNHGLVENNVGSVEKNLGSNKKILGSNEKNLGSIKKNVQSIEKEHESIEKNHGSIKKEPESIEKDRGFVEKDLGSNEKNLGSIKKNLVSEEKNLGSDKKTLGSHENNLGSDEKNLGSDKKTLGSGENNLGSDEKNLGSDKKTLGSGENNLGSDEKNLGSDKKILVSDENNLGSDEKNLGSDEKNLGSDKKTLGSGENNLGSDEKNLGSDKKTLGPDENNLGSDEKNLGSDKKTLGSGEMNHGSDEKNRRSVEKNFGSVVKNHGSFEKNLGSVEKKSGSSQKNSGSTELSHWSTEKEPESIVPYVSGLLLLFFVVYYWTRIFLTVPPEGQMEEQHIQPPDTKLKPTRVKQKQNPEDRLNTRPFPVPLVIDPKVNDNCVKYRLCCDHWAVNRCDETGLKLEGAGDMVFWEVTWDVPLLTSKQLTAAGPPFCLHVQKGRFRQLHLPHCQQLAGRINLLVVRVSDDYAEVVSPVEVTDTHVVIDFLGSSHYGLVMSSKANHPINGLVLSFAQVSTDSKIDSSVFLFLLPGNIVLNQIRKVLKDRSGLDFLECPSDCQLIPHHMYNLSAKPGWTQPQATVFLNNYHNFLPSFQVQLAPRVRKVKLRLMVKEEVVWRRQVQLGGSVSERLSQRPPKVGGLQVEIWNTLGDLSDDNFYSFQHLLTCLDQDRIPRSKVEGADRMTTAKMMVERYRAEAKTVTVQILREMGQNHLAENLEKN